MAVLPHRNKATNMARSLLQKLIYDYELENSTSVRKYIANKLLSLNAFIPQWLYNDYKLANCPELFYLFVKHNPLIEAADLLHALLEARSEYSVSDIEYKQELTDLEDVIQTYIDTTQRTANKISK
ncbi:nuclear pore complex protein Nup160 homolog [Anastrepha obliqua]|uniref:nuclear pore complex protein Nup160 homolog n=1 Tax=Anastrepha obliqua TaxID=95512 RepID=UPI0024095B32|nr:nuclear pore complex protein Nup160 homolog [Anastrepha obliqua]